MGEVADARRGPAVTGPTTPVPPPIPDPSATVPATSSVALAVLATRPEVLAARAAARASRTDMEDELDRLEAAARAAIDVRAKVKRNPARVAGAAAGVGFLAVGGPRKLFRGAKRAVFGKPDPLPDAMLPEEIEKALKALGPRRREGPRRARARLRRVRREERTPAAGPALDPRVLAPAHGSRADPEVRPPAHRGDPVAEGRLRRADGEGPRSPRRTPGRRAASRLTAAKASGSPVCDTRGWASGGMADAPALGAGAP